MSIFTRGVRLLLNHKKAVLYAYAANLLAAALVLVPFAVQFQESLGPGLLRSEMVDAIDYDWHELMQDRGDRLLRSFTPAVTGVGPFAQNLDALVTGKLLEFPPAIVAVGLLYILLNTFVSAAAIGSFALDPRGTSFKEFLRTGGEFFGRFFRLALLALAAFAAFRSMVFEPVRELIESATADLTVDRTVFFWTFSAFVAGLVLLAVINMVFDYAKIVTAAEDRTSVFLASLSAATFCVTNALPAFGLHALIGFAGVLWMALLVTAEQWIPQTGWWGIAAAIAVQQIHLIGRLAVRFLFYTVQMEFFLDRESLYRPEREATGAGHM